MAAIAHAFAEQNTEQTAAAAWGNISGATLASGNFTAGKKYLIRVTAQGGGTDRLELRMVHGATPTVFDGSQSFWAGLGTAGQAKGGYSWVTVWTAVSGEAINMQAQATAGTGVINMISMFVMNLSDDVVENTDWAFAEDSVDNVLSTTFEDGASITFTPPTADQDWWIVGSVQTDPGENTSATIIRINAGTPLLPEARITSQNTASVYVMGLSRVYTLAASSQTIKIQSATSTGIAHSHLHSSIFALNLNKFRNHSFVYTEADVSLSATDYATELATNSLTPSVVSDVFIDAFWGFDRNNVDRGAEFRVQNDQADKPAGQTTYNAQFHLSNVSNGVDDEEPLSLATMITSLSAAAHTIDLDASADNTTGTPAGQYRSLFAVTMELAVAVRYDYSLFPKHKISEAILRGNMA